MNLSVKKLRRGATVIGGSMLGLGLAAALATPALACTSEITGVASCLSADGTWSVTWSVNTDETDKQGKIYYVDETPSDAPLTNILVDKQNPVVIPAKGEAPLVGVETLKSTDKTASISIKAKYDGIRGLVTANSPWVNQPTEKCTPPSSAPATTPPTTKPTTTPPTTAPTSKPATTSPSASPSTSGPVLAVTGSSSAPLAGGAIAVVLIGGGAFFMARRRKMKFTA